MELDFSNCGLGSVELGQYTQLRKLSLANNEIKSLQGFIFPPIFFMKNFKKILRIF